MGYREQRRGWGVGVLKRESERREGVRENVLKELRSLGRNEQRRQEERG